MFFISPETYEFISQETGDPILEWRVCKWTGEKFPIYQSDKELLEQISPVIGGKKRMLPYPELGPTARQINRIAFRNERKFYISTCAKTGKKEISTISNDMNRPIYNIKDWYDEDFMKYGLDYSGDFMEDFNKLITTVPISSRVINNMENADYCNQETDSKNSYLNAGGHYNEDSMYNTYSLQGKDTVDNYRVLESEQIYKSINVIKSQKVFFSQFINNSFNIYFAYDLNSCSNVIFGHGLVNQSYVYKNKVLAKQEWQNIYEKYKEKLKSNKGLIEIQKEYDDFMSKLPIKAVWNINVENVVGNELANVKNGKFVLVGEEAEDVKYGIIFVGVKTSLDYESFGWGEKNYNIASSIKVNNSLSVSHCFGSDARDLIYSYFTVGGNNLFGCFGLTNKEYCILNKQYSKQEREEKVCKIIDELENNGKWGQFFDLESSPYPYNDTVANEYYPVKELYISELQAASQKPQAILNKNGIGSVTILEPEKFISDAILDLGGEEKIRIKWRTREQEINISSNIDAITANELSDNIEDIDDALLKQAIICKDSGRPFRIVSQELAFYRKHGLPLPRQHPDVRHMKKLSSKPGRYYHLVKCGNCNMKTLTTYYSDMGGRIWCEECYNKEVY